MTRAGGDDSSGNGSRGGDFSGHFGGPFGGSFGGYFGGLLRAAGLAAPSAGATPARPGELPGRGTSDPLDPFDPFAGDAADPGATDDPRSVTDALAAGASPAPAPPAPPHGGLRAPGAATPPAAWPSDAPPKSADRLAAHDTGSLMPQAAGMAAPNVQAALRWLAAAESGPPQHTVSLDGDAPPPSTAQSDTGGTGGPMAAASTAFIAPVGARGAADARGVNGATDGPARNARASALDPALDQAALASPTPAGAPFRAAPRPTPQAGAAARTAPDVYIGTLHVTLDAGAAARFASPGTGPDASRHVGRQSAVAATSAQPQRHGSSSSGGGDLSRSRLPRW